MKRQLNNIQRKWITAQVILIGLLFGLIIVPTAPTGIDDTEELPIGSEHPEYGTYLGLDTDGDSRYSTQILAGSKAATTMSPDVTNFNVWSDNGDGYVSIDSGEVTGFDCDRDYLYIGDNVGANDLESFLSFDIGNSFRYNTITKSLDKVEMYLKTYQKANLEGNEEVEIKEMNTNNKCGVGGDSDCNSGQEVYEMGRSGSKVVETSEFTEGVWEDIDITANSFLNIGDQGQINFYLEEDNFGDGELLILKSADTSDNPYLKVEYTLWSSPTANAVDITGEPTNLFPWQNYEVQTIVADADGRTNIDAAYLYLSADHSSYLVRFDWNRATGVFSQGVGASYVELNVSGCSNATNGATGWALSWNFTVTSGWQEGLMDWATYVTDNQGKNSGIDWNDQNTYHTDRLWLQDLDVEWITASTYLEDGDYVTTSESLNITGYVYWHTLTTVYDLAQGTPVVDLWVDGVDQGAAYNDLIDATGYFNISYTTPGNEDWDWSLDVVLDLLPTGLTEGPSNDNGKNPLFLVGTPAPPAFGATGTTITLTIQPNDMVPSSVLQSQTDEYMYCAIPESLMLDLGGWLTNYVWEGGRQATLNTLHLYYDVGYPDAMQRIYYHVTIVGGGGTGGTHSLYIGYRPGSYSGLYGVGNTLQAIGSFVLTDDRWLGGEVELILVVGENSTAVTEFHLREMYMTFVAITEEHIAARSVNGTSIHDTITVEVLQNDVDITLSTIPTTYSLVNIHNEGGLLSITDNIAGAGTLALTGCVKGTYYIVLDTGMTWHDVTFMPKLPDGLYGKWDDFTWWVNTTEITIKPYPLRDGFYNLLIKDIYDQTIVSENITILASDDRLLSVKYNVGMYRVGITNEDEISYYLLIHRQDTVGYQPLPASEFVLFRLYGLATGADYLCMVYNATDAYVGNFTIAMKNRPFSYVVDYITEESIEFTVIYPATVNLDDTCTVSGWVTWTNGTSITSYNAYGDWNEGGGFESLTKSGSTFYGSYTYNTTGIKIFQLRITLTGQANVTKTYTISVIQLFSKAVFLRGHIPGEGKPQEPIAVYGTARYANGTDLTGNVVVLWGDGSGSSSTALIAGAFSLVHTFVKEGAYSIAINYGTKWANGTVLIRDDPIAKGGGSSTLVITQFAPIIFALIFGQVVAVWQIRKLRRKKRKAAGPNVRPTAREESERMRKDADKERKRRF